MNEKNSKDIQQAEKGRKGFRSQFWFTSEPKDNKSNPETLKRPESSVSRQFQPRKQQGLTEAWAKQSQENRDDQGFNYTPFKSAPVPRAPSVSMLREGTPNPPGAQVILQPQTLNQSNGILPQNGFQSAYQQSYMRTQYPIYGVLPSMKEMHPQGQSTPKMAAHLQARPALATHSSSDAYHPKVQMSSMLPRPMSGTLWKSPAANEFPPPPPPGPYRPSSALNSAPIARPHSRAASELGLGVGLSSRYQSYCTLPRPEQVDYDQQSNYGSEIEHMAQQINMLYGSYNNKPRDMSANVDQKAVVSTQVGQHRPPSAMLAGAPGMASDYVKRRLSNVNNYHSDVQAPTLNSDEEIFKPSKDIIYFDGLSLLSVFQVVCAIVIFTCGVLRIIWHAKWSLGIELAYAIIVFITAAIGIYASSRRSYCTAAAAFALSGINSVIGIIPLIFGLLPAVPFVFPSTTLESFANDDESYLVDYLLSFSSFVEIVLAIILAIYGCKSLGTTMQHVEKLRLHADLNAAFENTSNSLQKNSAPTDKKLPLQ